MTLLRECDYCQRVDREFDPDEVHCTRCRELFAHAMKEAFSNMRDEFEAHVSAQMTILNLLRYLRDERAEAFNNAFGNEGVALLEQAIPEGPPSCHGTDDNQTSS